MNIVEKLRRLGETRNKSEISRRAGLGPNSFSAYLAKGSLPRCDIALRLARALDVSPEWLIDDEQDWPPVWRNAQEREPTRAA